MQDSQPAQAGLLDSEWEAAKELAKHRFIRAAGAVLERHLKEVCGNHNATSRKRGLSNLRPERLPEKRRRYRHASMAFHTVLGQYSGDVRILCAQYKESEPTTNQTNGLMAWVANSTKPIVTTMSGTHAPY